MRIALVTGWLSHAGGGVSAVVEALSSNLMKQGHEVKVFGSEDASWRDGEAAEWSGAPATAVATWGLDKLAYSPKLYGELLAWAPDLVHVHGIWSLFSLSVLKWSKATGKPYVISTHGMLDTWAVAQARWKKWIAGWFYEFEHLRRASCIHSLCSAETSAIRTFGLSNMIAEIPNGVVLPAKAVAATRAPSFNGLAPPNSRVMLFLGRLHPKKNIERLLDAWSEMRARSDRLQPWHLVVAGWGETGYVQALNLHRDSLGLQDVVHFVGPVRGVNKDALFRFADAFVLPSLSEGLPMAVLEAWSYSLPVLMTPECNLPGAFGCGAAIEIDTSTDGIGLGLTKLMTTDRRSFNSLGTCGRNLVEKEYTWDVVARSMGQVYHSVLCQKGEQ